MNEMNNNIKESNSRHRKWHIFESRVTFNGCCSQGTLTEGKGSVHLTSSFRSVVYGKYSFGMKSS